ncbi:MAG TPA: helix-turn-helix domain-containing protein [Acidimicrobiales bacterium]|nr:helix-turn-helix domain-containing protein [Acidimicrobiales bacterium]
MRDDPAKHGVAIVVYDGVTLFELAVASDIFGDDRWVAAGAAWYRLSLCAATAAVSVDRGFRIEVPDRLETIDAADTVIVPPTESLERVPDEVYDALRRAHRRGARILSLCTGAFVLATSGLLDGRRATTHWSECDALARRFPLVSVDPGVLYIDEGDIMTSAGSAASIDLCLHVVRQDHGAAVATQLARQLVVPPHRDGGQAQFIEAPMAVVDDSCLFADTLAWLQEHLDEAVTVEDLASRSAMSPRTFARQFRAGTGTTPLQWLIRQRVHLAQRLLETSDLSIDVVAERSGFCTAANLRKHFSRVLHTSPHGYRRTFKERAG